MQFLKLFNASIFGSSLLISSASLAQIKPGEVVRFAFAIVKNEAPDAKNPGFKIEGTQESVLLEPVAVSTSDLESAEMGKCNPQCPITLNFTEDGYKKLRNLTGRNIGRRMAMILDGKIVSAPVIKGLLSGKQVQITGPADEAKSKEFVAMLNAGAAPKTAPKAATKSAAKETTKK